MTVPMPRKPIELSPAVARGFALADAIREDGNDGVHNQPLGEADALDLQDFTVELLEALYPPATNTTAHKAQRVRSPPARPRFTATTSFRYTEAMARRRNASLMGWPISARPWGPS
jgi:hypothetical protein